VKQTLLGETESREKSKRGTLLCAKTHKKKKKKIPYSAAFNDGENLINLQPRFLRGTFTLPVITILSTLSNDSQISMLRKSQLTKKYHSTTHERVSRDR